jgi:hypothetical protein
MDNTAQDFARKILRELHNIGEALNSLVSKHPVSELHVAKSPNVAPPGVDRLLDAKVAPRPEHPANHHSPDEKKTEVRTHVRREWFEDHAVEIVGVAILLGYTIFAALQWSVMSGQLQQMKSGYRPWLGLAEGRAKTSMQQSSSPGMLTTPLTIDAAGTAHIASSITAKDFGSYPAQEVILTATLKLARPDGGELPYDAAKKECTMGIPAHAGTAVFPQETLTWAAVGSSFTKDQMKNARGNSPEFMAYMIGCIIYRDQYGCRRYTGFTYRLIERNSYDNVLFRPTPNSIIDGDWYLTDSFVDDPTEACKSQ